MTSLGKSLFFKDQAKVRRMLSKWNADDLATAAERAGKLERALMLQPPLPDREALGEELLAIARKARSRYARSARPTGAGKSCRADRGSNNAG